MSFYGLQGLKGLRKIDCIKSQKKTVLDDDEPPSWLGKCGCFRYRKRLCVPEPYNYYIDTGKPVDFPRQYIKKQKRKAVIPWIYNLRIGEHDMEDDGSTSPSSSDNCDVSPSEIPPPPSPSLKLRLCVPKPYYYKPWDENEPYEVSKDPETPCVSTQCSPEPRLSPSLQF